MSGGSSDYITDSQPAPVTGVGTSAHDLVIADLTTRKQFGWDKYKKLLLAYNGRDAETDRYDEALDLVVYFRTMMEEKRRYPAIIAAVRSEVTRLHDRADRIAAEHPDEPNELAETLRAIAAVFEDTIAAEPVPDDVVAQLREELAHRDRVLEGLNTIIAGYTAGANFHHVAAVALGREPTPGQLWASLLDMPSDRRAVRLAAFQTAEAQAHDCRVGMHTARLADVTVSYEAVQAKQDANRWAGGHIIPPGSQISIDGVRYDIVGDPEPAADGGTVINLAPTSPTARAIPEFNRLPDGSW